MSEEKLVKDHELYVSVGLKIAMKPSEFQKVVDDLLFDHIGYMDSWGTHTKAEYIGIIDKQHEEIKRLRAEHAAMKEALEFYAAESTYDIDHLSKHGFMIIDRDDGEKARTILSTLKKEQTNE